MMCKPIHDEWLGLSVKKVSTPYFSKENDDFSLIISILEDKLLYFIFVILFYL
jgi:hypothetical protein